MVAMVRELLSADEANELLFRKLVETFRNTDIPSNHRTSSTFVVYAHDSIAPLHDEFPAYANISKWIIEQLRSLYPHTLSDRGPLPLFESRVDQNDSCHDIVANQACLLPGFQKSSHAGQIATVDKAIICISPRLVRYLNTAFAKRYMKAVQDAYMKNQNCPRKEIIAKIRDLVHSYHKNPDFHHVLTEYGLITLDKNIFGFMPRVILVTLNPETLAVPSFSSTDLQIIFPTEGPLMYPCLFKVLRRIFESEDHIIQLYADAFGKNKAARHVNEAQFHAKIAGLIHSIHQDTKRLSVQGVRHRRHREDIVQLQSAQKMQAATTTAPGPSSNIPFPPDKQFVQHGDLLERIHRECTSPYSTIALVGPAGVGKSQLAIQYAHEVRKQHPDTWVFWVHASNASRFEQGFRRIADLVDLAGRHDPQAEIFKLVHDWLCGGSRRRWKLILDNVDDPSFLLGTPGTQHANKMREAEEATRLLDYIPSCENGSILVTSRSKRAVKDLVEPPNIILVEPMTDLEATALVEMKLGSKHDRDSMRALATALECMPLAIIQATSYIVRRAPLYSVQKYLDVFEQSDLGKTTLLDGEVNGKQFRRDAETKNSIIITWQISFNHIQRTRPSAAGLLSLMSFCDRQGIPKCLLEPFITKEDNSDEFFPSLDDLNLEDPPKGNEKSPSQDTNSGSSTSGTDFELDVNILHDYSLISVDEDNESFSMHALVQLATKRWLEKNGQFETWELEFLARLGALLPEESWEGLKTWSRLLPHAIGAKKNKPKSPRYVLEWTEVLRKLARYLGQAGRGQEAQTMAEGASDLRIKIFGRAHQQSQAALRTLAFVHYTNGHWRTAEGLFREVIEMFKQQFGPIHEMTLVGMESLAGTLYSQGRPEEAEKLQVEVLQLRMQILGHHHPETLRSIANFAVTLCSQGRLKEAEKLGVEVLQLRKQILGHHHPGTLRSMVNFAEILRRQGRLEEAEKLEIEVLQLYKQILGHHHPDTLRSTANFAITLRSQGRLKEAEKLEIEVLQLRKQILGHHHPETLISMGSLAATLYSQGRLEEAEKLQVEVLQLYKQILGHEHPDTLTYMNNLSFTWWALARKHGAISLMEECVHLSRTRPGQSHQCVVSRLRCLHMWKKDRNERPLEAWLEEQTRRTAEGSQPTRPPRTSLATLDSRGPAVDQRSGGHFVRCLSSSFKTVDGYGRVRRVGRVCKKTRKHRGYWTER